MRAITRKEFVALAASAGAGGLLLGALPQRRAAAYEEGVPSYVTNALEHQTYEMFQGWFSWLQKAGKPGFLGETSTPNREKGWASDEIQRWLTLFDKVYKTLDDNEATVPVVTAHSASHSSFNMDGLRVYVPLHTSGLTMLQRDWSKGMEQSVVLEAHPATSSRMRGMNAGSGAMTPTKFSAQNPGTYGRDYVYPDAADYSYLLSRGLNVVRGPFRWERLQPKLGGPLKSEELARLIASYDDAASVGMNVIPSVQNYGGYFLTSSSYAMIGSRQLPVSSYTAFIKQLTSALKGHPAAVGLDIMNEPCWIVGGAPAWEKTSVAAVNAGQEGDPERFLWVSGYHTPKNRSAGLYAGLYSFLAWHPSPWLPLGNCGYTSHAYYGPGAGYPNLYDDVVAYWERLGY